MSNVDEQVAKLRERMGRERVNWIPETAGESIIGVVEESTYEEGDYGQYRRLHLYDEGQPGKEFVVRCFGAVLSREVDRVNNGVGPRHGDIIAITYQGEGKVKKGKFAGKDMKIFTVMAIPSSPEAGAPDYAAVQAEAQKRLEAEAAEPWADDEDE